MDWTRCCICQNSTSETLRCPINKRCDAGTVYSDFLLRANEFSELGELPYNSKCINFTMEDFVQNKASWHKTCYDKLSSYVLNIIKMKKRKSTSEVESHVEERKSKRLSINAFNNTKCLFCQSTNEQKLHAYATNTAEQKLREMATYMNDTDLLTRISGGDFVAIEAKYHLWCLTQYRNNYNKCLKQNQSTHNKQLEQTKAISFARIICGIETSLENGIAVFSLSEIHATYEQNLRDLGHDISMNRTRLKDKVLDHFEYLGIIEKTQGKGVMLVFPEGLNEILNDFSKNQYEENVLMFAKVSKICRKEMFEIIEPTTFAGVFPPNCQENAISDQVTLLLSMILYGIGDKSRVTQPCLTLSQLVTLNSKKTSKPSDSEAQHHRNSPIREPPLPLYLGLNIHTTTRNKKLIDELSSFGITISYDRVLQIENSLAVSLCNQFESTGQVCPPHLKKSIFTVGALDNLDHNPSATTAHGSFHGTGISIMQFPSADNPGTDLEPPKFEIVDTSIKPSLPQSYDVVPAVSMVPHATTVPKSIPTNESTIGKLDTAKSQEVEWINAAVGYIDQEKLDKNQFISWAAFHSTRQSPMLDPPAIIAMLPMFFEKADSPAMIKHGMNILMKLTDFLNPGQISVLTCDCPIFACSKYIQWTWPETHGEDKLVIMFGGLHIEKGIWNAMGDLLEGSGWIESLTDANVATSGTADSYLKCSHITRTRHAHQLTALALSKLQRDAFAKVDNVHCDYETWRKSMVEKSPTFQFWDLVLRTELLSLIFIRAHRENDFDLYVETLEALMFLFFALSKFNYCRWLSIHIRDMKSLPASVKDDFKKNWVVNKASRRFSHMPLDQAHEQENSKVKGKGGVVGLTENKVAFERWMISGPAQAKLLAEFESEYLTADNEIDMHHEEGLSTQQRFHTEMKDLIDAINEYGNPFEEDSNELIVLHSRNCASESVSETLRTFQDMGTTQYETYKQDVIINQTRSIHDPIKKNVISLLKTPRKKAKSSKIATIRNDVTLFSRLYIANQKREGDASVFFSHENQLHPPSLSDNGKLRSGTKADLLSCLKPSNVSTLPEIDAKIVDGPVLVHSLPTKSASTFKEYSTKIFIPHIKRQLESVKRVDVVWDRYVENSIKGTTRQKRGTGQRTKVSERGKLPIKWKDFLCVDKNKVELFDFLTRELVDYFQNHTKPVYVTSDIHVITNSNEAMEDCYQEEADTRIIVHLRHALACGSRNIVIRTVDSDVIIILIGHFHDLLAIYPDMQIFVEFGVGKHHVCYSINTLGNQLGPDKARALPLFHSFTGCDSTSFFFRKGKKTAWSAWQSYPEVTSAFLSIRENPFGHINTSSSTFLAIERFTIVLYNKTSSHTSVNKARREMFTKPNSNLDSIPPTQDALLQHTKRAIYQSTIWTTATQCQPSIPPTDDWGWVTLDGTRQPLWMTLPHAAIACTELIKCSCKSARGCVSCKCTNAELPCTELCTCACERE